VNKTYLHSSTMSDVFLCGTKKDAYIEKHRGTKPGSELILERENEVLQQLNGVVGPRVIKFNEVKKILTMTKIGTHDLSDVLHDLPIESIPILTYKFFEDLNKIHERGFVHRDIKPGNIMVKVDNRGVYDYAGIVDFGMTLRSNKKQNEPLAIGGTKPYTHPTQSSKEFKETRTNPGQDWFAAARTISHLLVGGSSPSFEALIKKGDGAEASNLIKLAFNRCFGSRKSDAKPLLDLLLFSVKPESESQSELMSLLHMGTNALESLQIYSGNYWSTKNKQISFQDSSRHRPKRHDVLLIVDNTESMQSEIEFLKRQFDEIAELVKGRIDLRIDLWSLGDYSDGGKSSITPLGQRMRSDTFQQCVGNMEATVEQKDEAEAYEVALQRAYLKKPENFWNPRETTKRTIILVGDSYAHGWLDSNEWRNVIEKARGHLDKNTSARGDPDPEMKALYDDFCRRHAHYMTWEIEKEEREAFKKAKGNKKLLDEKGKPQTGGHVFVPGEVHLQRPNYKKAISGCVNKNATIHTIGIGNNPVSSSFMKYVAMFGKGTFTKVGNGELIIALKGIFSSVDAKIFHDMEKETLQLNPTTQALNSITTFVIDSMSEE
jgi:serine/threonine protein kinase